MTQTDAYEADVMLPDFPWTFADEGYFGSGNGSNSRTGVVSPVQWTNYRVHDHITSSNPRLSDGRMQKAFSFTNAAFPQLAESMGASITSGSAEFWDKISHHQVGEEMHNQLIRSLENVNGSSKWESLLPTVFYAIYLSSNNLLTDSTTDKLVQWICRAGKHWIFGHLMGFKAPWTDILGSNFLVSAARLGDAKIVNTLLRKGIRANTFVGGSQRKTALQEAVRYHRLRIVQLLLDAGADPKPQHGSWRSVLHDAVSGPYNREIMQALIEKGADVNGPFDRFYYLSTVLVSAARKRDLAIIRILLEAGARIDEVNQDSETALQVSVSNADADAVRVLIDAGAKIDAPSGEYFRGARHAAVRFGHLERLATPIQRASQANNIELVDILLQEGADVNACPWDEFVDYIDRDEHNYFQDRSLLTALQAAVANKNTSLVQVLLKSKAKIDTRGCGDPPLTIAAANGDSDMVQILLSHGAKINGPASTHYGRTALQAAASTGHCKTVQQILKAGANVNATASHTGGRTALQAAAECGHIELIRVLIKAGADPNAGASTIAGRTCLQAAAKNGHLDCVRLLLEAGAELKDPPSRKRGISTITAAIESRNTELVRFLLQFGLGVNRNEYEQSPLGAAAAQGSLEIVSLLITAGADVNECCNTSEDYSSGETPLQVAAVKGNMAIATRLLEAGARHDIQFFRPESRSALQCAVQGDCTSLVELLLAKRTYTSEESLDRSIALSQAMSKWPINVDIVSALLNANVNVNYVPAHYPRHPPLHSAAQAGSIELVQLLLEAGANVNATDFFGGTILECALEKRNLLLVQILLDAGAEVNAPASTVRGRTALQKAVQENNMNAVSLLLSRNADVNASAARIGGATALQAAVIKGNINMVRLLLKAGAHVNAPPASSYGRMALDAAAERGRLDILLLLLEHDDDVEALDHRCRRAAHVATLNGHHAILTILKEYRKDSH